MDFVEGWDDADAGRGLPIQTAMIHYAKDHVGAQRYEELHARSHIRDQREGALSSSEQREFKSCKKVLLDNLCAMLRGGELFLRGFQAWAVEYTQPAPEWFTQVSFDITENSLDAHFVGLDGVQIFARKTAEDAALPPSQEQVAAIPSGPKPGTRIKVLSLTAAEAISAILFNDRDYPREGVALARRAKEWAERHKLAGYDKLNPEEGMFPELARAMLRGVDRGRDD